MPATTALRGDRVELAGGEVVEQEQRLRALHQQVVDAHRDDVEAGDAVAAALRQELHLGADAVGRGDQERLLEARLAQVEQAAEAAELGARAGARGRAGQRRDRLDQRVPGVDINSGAADSGSRRACSSVSCVMAAGLARLALEASWTMRRQLRRSGRLCNAPFATRLCAARRPARHRPRCPRRRTRRAIADVFQVSGIEVDATAANAVAAREQALRARAQGRARAPAAPAGAGRASTRPAAERSATWRSSATCRTSRSPTRSSSATRYLAELTVRYEPDAVRELLQSSG